MHRPPKRRAFVCEVFTLQGLALEEILVCRIVFPVGFLPDFANMPILTDATEMSPTKKAKTAPAEDRPVLRFAKLSENATNPTRGSARAAGYDLYRFVVQTAVVVKSVWHSASSVALDCLAGQHAESAP